MTQSQERKEYWRRRLPHIDRPGLVQSVTFRLIDSLPREQIKQLLDSAWQPRSDWAHAQLEKHLSNGYGECWLQQPRIAEIVQNSLLFFDGSRYDLLAWVIMPNHVHVVFTPYPDYALPDVVGSWKKFTARKINKLLNREGRFWYPEYYDRYMRDDKHLNRSIDYIHNNPVSAGLVESPNLWPWSSFLRYYPECAPDS